jgi:hypothetical protein
MPWLINGPTGTKVPCIILRYPRFWGDKQLDVHLCLDLGEASLVLGQHVGCTGTQQSVTRTHRRRLGHRGTAVSWTMLGGMGHFV